MNVTLGSVRHDESTLSLGACLGGKYGPGSGQWGFGIWVVELSFFSRDHPRLASNPSFLTSWPVHHACQAMVAQHDSATSMRPDLPGIHPCNSFTLTEQHDLMWSLFAGCAVLKHLLARNMHVNYTHPKEGGAGKSRKHTQHECRIPPHECDG